MEAPVVNPKGLTTSDGSSSPTDILFYSRQQEKTDNSNPAETIQIQDMDDPSANDEELSQDKKQSNDLKVSGSQDTESPDEKAENTLKIDMSEVEPTESLQIHHLVTEVLDRAADHEQFTEIELRPTQFNQDLPKLSSEVVAMTLNLLTELESPEPNVPATTTAMHFNNETPQDVPSEVKLDVTPEVPHHPALATTGGETSIPELEPVEGKEGGGDGKKPLSPSPNPEPVGPRRSYSCGNQPLSMILESSMSPVAEIPPTVVVRKQASTGWRGPDLAQATTVAKAKPQSLKLHDQSPVDISRASSRLSQLLTETRSKWLYVCP